MSKQITKNINKLEWSEAKQSFPGDVFLKTLREESKNGAKTIIVKIPEGGQITSHNHLGLVQHLILEGSYECDGEVCTQGTYRIMEPHSDVATITSVTGAVVLVIYDPIQT
jgi:hypothetical protein